MMPLQFCDFSYVPLQFSYLQPCHYNSLSTWLMPFSAAAATSGPPAGRRTHTILPYGRLCPSPTWIEPEPSRECLARPHTQLASPVLPRRRRCHRRRAPHVLLLRRFEAIDEGQRDLHEGVVSVDLGRCRQSGESCSPGRLPFLPLLPDLYPEQATGHLQRAVLQVPEQREG